MSIEITRDTLANGKVLEFIREEAQSSPESGHTVLSDRELAQCLDDTLASWDGRSDIWLFGYGSLILNPAFHFAEKRIALLQGWQRRFCLWLRIGRGSPENPGLMLALDRGDACRGMAFRIPAAEVRTELPLIWVRERATGAYAAKWVSLETDQGMVPAITFVADREHPLYAGPLPEEQAASLITKASGRLGTCVDYLLSTADHLKEIGLSDPHLEDLAVLVRDGRYELETQQAAD